MKRMRKTSILINASIVIICYTFEIDAAGN